MQYILAIVSDINQLKPSKSKIVQSLTFNSHQIRIQTQDGEIWFCGADVARAIGYKNPAEAIADNVSPKHSRQLC